VNRRAAGSSVKSSHAATIRAWLTEDQEAPRKQRHTAGRIWERLIDEQGADVAESTVRRYVRACAASYTSITSGSRCGGGP
jgi:hypothetical protein